VEIVTPLPLVSGVFFSLFRLLLLPSLALAVWLFFCLFFVVCVYVGKLDLVEVAVVRVEG